MKMAETADEAVRSAFRIEGSPTTTWHLMAIKWVDSNFGKLSEFLF